MEELYYNEPTQVRYWNKRLHKYAYGIVFHDYLIDSVFGGFTKISNILEGGIDYGLAADDIIIELEWLSLENAIRGQMVNESNCKLH